MANNSKPEFNIGVPPHNIDAEKSVLGALMIDPNSIIKIIEFLRAHHFYNSSHQAIYKAIETLYEARDPVDLITVPNELKKMEMLTKIGGVTYLTELVNSVPTAANIVAYANVIRNDALRRGMITAGSEIVEIAHHEADIEVLMDRAEQQLFAVSKDKIHKDFTPVRETLEISFERLDELSKQKGALRGVATGMKTLDKILSGMQKQNLIILAARPSMGKSSLAINMAQFAAINKKVGVAIFSLEMSTTSIVDRMISAQGDIDNWRISTGNLEADDFEKYSIAAGELAEAPIFIDDTPGISVMEMRTKARRLQMDQEIGLIVVDYLQLIRGRGLDNRVQEVAEISQALKNLARELDVPVLALSQLSRAVEQRGGDKKPQLSDLRDSGSIEQDADVVMFLYRSNDEDRSNMGLIVAKHRNGATGEIPLFFRGDRTRFFEAEKAKSEE